MSIESRIEKLRKETLQSIVKAASVGDSASVIQLSGKAKRIEMLCQDCQKLETELTLLETAEEEAPALRTHQTARNERELHRDNGRNAVEFGRELGRKAREAYVDKLRRQGTQLHRINETQFKTARGSLIGIAFATERQPNRWFLGLRDKSYKAVILLCKRNSGELLDFIVGGHELQSIKSRLVASSGDLKFHVRRDGGNYLLLVPRQTSVSLDRNRQAEIKLQDL